MSDLEKYLENTLGIGDSVKPVDKTRLGKLPFYIAEAYNFSTFHLLNRELLFIKPIHEEDVNTQQVSKNIDLIKNQWSEKLPVLILDHINAINRKRLVDKGINFIVPGKQLFLPGLLISLQERFIDTKKNKVEGLIPSAQFLLLYHLLHKRDWSIEAHSFKEIAEKFNYTAMTITKAADNLRNLELAEIHGQREKSLQFRSHSQELWMHGLREKLLTSPVSKRFFTDQKPTGLLMSNASALPEYSEMNPSKQKHYALFKTKYYSQPKSIWKNVNEFEGEYCIEIWKYDPELLADGLYTDSSVVDPLSLYLSLRDTKDERIEMALDQIIEKNLW